MAPSKVYAPCPCHLHAQGCRRKHGHDLLGAQFRTDGDNGHFPHKILWYKFVRRETVSDYLEGIEWLRSKGFRIHGIVCDGLRGLFHELRSYNVQMCQFHQMMIVRRYLTNKPELPASRELLDICYMMTRTDKESFVGMLEGWQARWEYFLNERSEDKKTGKTSYTHKRLRSAYLSLKRNMP